MLNVNSFQFNLAINDHPDVAAEVKKVTSGLQTSLQRKSHVFRDIFKNQ